MRINIREQLGLLTLLCSLIGLAVIAIATASLLPVLIIYMARLELTISPSVVGDQLQLCHRHWVR